ncbi:unnamed protein product [Cuscuta campestris]|uniref:Uncharacterized protein n=1 Tax=Cuscuta campestris TaxID=132261 RepID=A0A484NAB4_9ASTE|nr:unnamed protein product [Cuscuta campestris]
MTIFACFSGLLSGHPGSGEKTCFIKETKFTCIVFRSEGEVLRPRDIKLEQDESMQESQAEASNMPSHAEEGTSRSTV